MDSLPQFNNPEDLSRLEHSSRGLCFLVMRLRDQHFGHISRTEHMGDFSEALILEHPRGTDRLISLVLEHLTYPGFHELEQGNYLMNCYIPFELIEPSVEGADRQALVLKKPYRGFNIQTSLLMPKATSGLAEAIYTRDEIDPITLEKVMDILASTKPKIPPISS